MASLNKVILMGNLTRDPEARRTTSGTSVCKLGLAVNRRFKSATGEMREEVTFVDIDVWGRQADFCRDYLRKGAPVFIDGRLKLEQWDDRATGQKRSRLGVVAESVQSLSTGPRDGSNANGGEYAAPKPYQQQGTQQQQVAPQQQGTQQQSYGGGYQQPSPQPPPPPQQNWNAAPAPQPIQQPVQQPTAPLPPPFPAQDPMHQTQTQSQPAPQAPPAPDAFDVSDESIDDIPF